MYNGYAKIASEAHFEATQGTGRLLDLAGVVCIAKVSDRTPLKISTPKRMLQRLSIALAEVKPKQILATESCFKMMKNPFHFNLKVLFILNM